MAGRAANGVGSVRRRETSKGVRWDAQATVVEALTGRKRRVSKRGFATQREAREWCSEQARKPAASRMGERTLVRDALDAWLASAGLTKATTDAYRAATNHLAKECEGKRMMGVRVEDFESAMSASDPARATASVRLSAYRKFATWAEAKGMIGPDVTRALGTLVARGKTATKRTPATIEEVRAVIGVESDRSDMWRLLAGSGIRQGEARALERKHVLSPTTVLVERTAVHDPGRDPGLWFGPTKTRRARVVGIPAQVGETLLQYEDGLLWHWKGTPLSTGSVVNALRRDCKAAGVRILTPHQFRHFWATTAMREGVSPRVVQEQLGHSSVATTLSVYTTPASEDVQRAANIVASW